MTLIFKNMASSTSNVSTGSTTGKVSTEASVNTSDGNAPVVDQSFSQLLGGGETEKSLISLSDAATLLEGLLQNTSLKENTSTVADPLVQLLQGLNDDMTKLDEAITEDPALMAILQGWLQQVNTLLNPNELGSQPIDLEEASTISKLADDPGTIRFALQDGLSQLVALLQNKDITTNTSAQAVQLLASFEGLLQAAGVVDQQKSLGTAQGNTTTDHASSNQNVTVSRLTDNQGISVQSRAAVLSNQNVVPSSSTVQTDQSVKTVQGTLLTQSNIVPAALASVDEDSTVKEVDALSTSEGTFTAGELVMREGIKNPLKAAAAAIPVEQFAKEMTSFVVNKLDIVKQNGMTEARISLYPEHLGQVDIKITMLNGQLVATFMTEHAGAKDLLEQQMSQLRTALQSQGLQVEKLEVTQNQSLQSHMYQDGRQPSAGQQQSNRRSKERDGQSDDSLVVAELTEEWNDRLSAQINTDNGSTFVAKA
ncbi:flagellar hook-length control protein FliK [Paenibacillus macquariensis]|uniref:Flagellar hook-length control protein FliK n=1 Tax=Paenibacillus macquariensis TaxID=948756 RepID=A0ABY1JZU9_9BACL|nr:flagellar hook-length control protein FliK [Paenibacillus macquariensis]MEC0091404.1 flagellar hook-length control protein FliK [Paenibacillus macquariensis]OAB38087.1 hypothetical protein PMSM_02815 [Paenibacillus macquariensis subsp. macquariensis]SIR06018.1 flagellar hook-length control protein FliK [Paenibacillus macquariensis]